MLTVFEIIPAKYNARIPITGSSDEWGSFCKLAHLTMKHITYYWQGRQQSPPNKKLRGKVNETKLRQQSGN